MNNIPLSEATMSEVLARVSFRCIHWFDRNREWTTSTPQEKMGCCAVWLSANKFGVLAMWVRAYCVQWAPLHTTIDIREQFIDAARDGYTMRRVAYPLYKKARRDPRVTNRGVTRRASDERA